jgi:hypothetical protein
MMHAKKAFGMTVRSHIELVKLNINPIVELKLKPEQWIKACDINKKYQLINKRASK